PRRDRRWRTALEFGRRQPADALTPGCGVPLGRHRRGRPVHRWRALVTAAMRIAFSKPVVDDELDRLMTGYRAAGYEGLQLKTGQFMPWVDRPAEFQAKWGSDR